MVQETEERIRALESDVNQLKHLTRLKDEDLRSLRETNTALVNQIRSRWTVVQALSVLLAFFFAIAFGYEVAEVIEVHHLVRQVTDALDRVDESVSVITATAHVVPLLASGYNNHSDRKFGRGEVDATEAMDGIVKYRAELGKDSPLHKPMDSLRRGALVLQARCAYLAQEWTRLKHAATELLALDSSAWDGYHFRGLYRYEYENDVDGAIDDYERSLGERERYNPDAFNLTELYFTDRYWPDFDADALNEAIDSFSGRQRRFGMTGKQVEEIKGA